MFLSKEGSGALQLAMAFAQYILCERVNGASEASSAPSLFGEVVEAPAVPSSDSCGVCPACIKAEKLIHPDIHFSYPVITKKSGERPVSADYIQEWREFVSIHPYGNVYDWLQFIDAENKQGNITAEECNEIIRTMNLKSFESGYKILIIWMPEYLTKNGNKLLKLIEEPPPNTLFILVAQNEEQILPTILSRTQLVKIPALHQQDIESSLELNSGVSVEKALQVAQLADGNYREAIQLLQHIDNDWLNVVREWLNFIVKKNTPGQIKWIEDIAKQGRENQKQLLMYFIHLLEDAIRLGILQTGAGQHSKEPGHAAEEFCLKLNKMCSIYQQEAIVHELEKACYYIERNANSKILFNALSIKLFHIICNNSLILVS